MGDELVLDCIPEEVFVKMQQSIATAAPSQTAKAKVEVDTVHHQNFDEVVQTLSLADFEQLVLAIKSNEQDRTNGIITALQAQLAEHQSLLNRLDESETEREKLAEHNRILGKMTCIQNSRIHDLEAQVVALKLEVANEKAKVDHANLNVHQLTARTESLENEIQSLKKMISSDEEQVHFAGLKIPGTNATKALLSSVRGKRASWDLCSSIRTNCTETSTTSEVTETSRGALARSFTAVQTYRNLSDALKESGEESDSEHETKVERNLKKTTKGWTSERVVRRNRKGRNDDYYHKSFSG
eukprot:scaffold18270_cov63-Cyclotella_meneghiniana.AAC.4